MQPNEAVQLIRSLDYSHIITTDVEFCVELFEQAMRWRPKKTLELGAGWGISGTAIGMISRFFPVDSTIVDNGLEADMPQVQAFWAKHGVEKRLVMADVLDYLKATTETYDFIFHDASSDEKGVEQLRLAWGILNPGGVLAAHNAHTFDHQSLGREFGSLPTVFRDRRRRGLAVYFKAVG